MHSVLVNIKGPFHCPRIIVRFSFLVPAEQILVFRVLAELGPEVKKRGHIATFDEHDFRPGLELDDQIPNSGFKAVWHINFYVDVLPLSTAIKKAQLAHVKSLQIEKLVR
jgi:hypothetical protein